MKITDCCKGAFVFHFSSCSLSGAQGLASSANQSNFSEHCPPKHERDATTKKRAHPKSLKILPVQSKQDSQQHELAQEADMAQSRRSRLEGSFTASALIVLDAVMSARAAANSFMSLSPYCPFTLLSLL